MRRLLCIALLSAALAAAPAPAAQTVVLRDSIGPDNTWTNGNYFRESHDDNVNPTIGKSIIPFELTAPADSDLLLTSFQGIAGGPSSQLDLQPVFSEIDYFVRLYSTMDEAKGPGISNGTLENFRIDLAGDPLPFGESFVQPPFPPYPTFLLEFDLEPLGILIPAGETRVFAIQGVGDSLEYGALLWIESNDPFNPPDWVFSDFQGNWLTDKPVGVRITGELIPEPATLALLAAGGLAALRRRSGRYARPGRS